MALTLPRHGPAWGASGTEDLAPCTSVQPRVVTQERMRAPAPGAGISRRRGLPMHRPVGTASHLPRRERGHHLA
nr:hypothetical protein [Actinomyces oris]